jgi:peptidyl-prolyl cis-trans isomerase C
MVVKCNAAHILVPTEQEAKMLMGRISNGENFADLAKKYSKCPSAAKGGDLGWFGRKQMAPQFEKAAFDGQKGKVVGPVKTEFGYHLIRIIDQR